VLDRQGAQNIGEDGADADSFDPKVCVVEGGFVALIQVCVCVCARGCGVGVVYLYTRLYISIWHTTMMMHVQYNDLDNSIIN